MMRLFASAFALVLLAGTASADAPLKEGRSASTCSDATLVCVVLKNGTSKPSGECAARGMDAAKIIPGDCFDPD